MINNILDYNTVYFFELIFSLSILLSSSIADDRFFDAGRCATVDGHKVNLTHSPSPSRFRVFLPTLWVFEWATEHPRCTWSRWTREFWTTWFESPVELMCCCVWLACVRLPCVVFCVCGRDAKKTTLVFADNQFSSKRLAIFTHTCSDNHL